MTDMTVETASAPGNGRKKIQRATMVEKRKIYKLLEDHLDTDAREYRDGWSDVKVAEVTGVALPTIIHMRRVAFCPLKSQERKRQPKHIPEINLEELEGRLVDTLTLLTESKLEASGHAISGIRSQVESLREQVEAAREQMRSFGALLSLPGRIGALEEKIKELKQERAVLGQR